MSNYTDAQRLDWLDQNVFAGEKDDWERRMRPDQQKWVLFAPNGHQGSARNIIDAAMRAHGVIVPATPQPAALTPGEAYRIPGMVCGRCGCADLMHEGAHQSGVGACDGAQRQEGGK